MKLVLRLLSLLLLAIGAHGADQRAPTTNNAAGTVWRGSREDLFRQLKEWQAPQDMLEAVLLAHANRRAASTRLAIFYPNGVKPWRPPSPTKEGRAQLEALNKQTRTEIEALLGRPLGSEASEPEVPNTIWRASKSDLLNQLREWQAPDDIVLAVLFAHERPISAPEMQSIRKGAKRMSRMMELNAVYARSRAEIRELMGPDFDVALIDTLLDPGLKIKWGNLSRDQMARIKYLMELEDSAVVAGEGYSDYLSPASLATASAIDQKFATDVRAVLGPEATDKFLIFNSRAAVTLQKRLARAGVEVDEATYRTLFRRGREFRADLAQRPIRHSYDPGLEETRLFEEVLGPERAVALAAASMSNFGTMNKSLVADGADARTRLDIYYTYMETSIRAFLAHANPPAAPGPEQETIARDGERLYRLLEAKLSPERFAAFKASGDGRMVDEWRETGRIR